MTGQHHRRVVEIEEPVADAGDEGLLAAAREVGAPHAAVEERVSREEHVLGVEADAPHGVSRRLDDPHGHVAGLVLVAVGDGEVGFGRRDVVGDEPQRVVHGRAAARLDVVLVDAPLGARRLPHLRHAAHMVHVAVGVQDVLHRDPKLLDRLENSVGLSSGIDDDGLFGLFVTDEIDVLREGRHGEHVEDH